MFFFFWIIIWIPAALWLIGCRTQRWMKISQQSYSCCCHRIHEAVNVVRCDTIRCDTIYCVHTYMNRIYAKVCAYMYTFAIVIVCCTVLLYIQSSTFIHWIYCRNGLVPSVSVRFWSGRRELTFSTAKLLIFLDIRRPNSNQMIPWTDWLTKRYHLSYKWYQTTIFSLIFRFSKTNSSRSRYQQLPATQHLHLNS